MKRDEAVARIDAALIDMRRFWTSPSRPQSLRQDVGGGIELSTVLVVDAIRRRGGSGAEVSVSEVADQLDVAHSTASRLVERAVDVGVVRRLPHPDRRRTALELTESGHRLVVVSARFRAAHVAAVVHDWSEEDLATFAGLLGRFAEHARGGEPPGPTSPPHQPT